MKLEPFKIKKKLSLVMFKLELPRDAKIYSVFYTALLETALSQIPVQTTLQVKKEKKYEVKKILDSRKIKKG